MVIGRWRIELKKALEWRYLGWVEWREGVRRGDFWRLLEIQSRENIDIGWWCWYRGRMGWIKKNEKESKMMNFTKFDMNSKVNRDLMLNYR